MNLKEYILKNTKIREIKDDLKFLPRRHGLGFVFEARKIDKKLLNTKKRKNSGIVGNIEVDGDDLLFDIIKKRFKR